jgi:hypothetical protein
MQGFLNAALPIAAVLVLASALVPGSLLLVAAILNGLVALVVIEMPNLERAAAAHAEHHQGERPIADR